MWSMLSQPRTGCPNCDADFSTEAVEVAPAVFVCDRCLHEIPVRAIGAARSRAAALVG
jgi:hypothetical protein